MAEEQDVFTSIAQKSNEPSKTIGSKEVISQDDLPKEGDSGSGKPIRVLKTSAVKEFEKLSKLTTDGFAEMNSSIKDGFELMKGSFLEFGKKIAESIEKLDSRSKIAGAKQEQEAGPAVQNSLAK